MSDTNLNNLLQTMDAQQWAQAFCKLHPEIDEGTMITWFANALMTGWDHRDWETPEYKSMIASILEKPNV